MLKEDARVGAVATMVVVAVGTVYGSPLALVEQRSVCRTEYMLLAQVDTYSRLTQQPRSMSVESSSVYVHTVIVLAVLCTLLATCQLIVVDVAVPIYRRREHQTLIGKRTNVGKSRCHEAACSLPLVVEAGAVECRCAIILRRQSALPRQIDVARLQSSHIIHATTLEIAVDCATVALRIASAELLADVARAQTQTSIATECAERASFGRHTHTALLVGARHDVDGAIECRRSEHTCRSTLENLDALNVRKRNGKIGCIMAGLRA